MGRLIEIAGNTVPANAAGTLARYLIHHVPPGSFIEAVLRNNLFGAIGKADECSMAHLRDIVRLVVNHIPMSIVGMGYNDWLRNNDKDWHDAAVKYHGERWEPYLDM